ncbi:MAG: hypothetical protein U5K30_02290 [Acidimicrobiales bacterium]|nr:hypothetical protein [Acidimicrobiales bacterium]
MRHRHVWRALVGVFAATTLVAACGDDTETATDTTTTTADTTADSTANDGGHDHGGRSFEAVDPVPTVEVEATEDAKAGWNIHVMTTDFTFTPEKVNDAETTSGEGHAHLYVDGTKINRLYGSWYHLGGELEPGEHEVRVELNANDHRPYVADGTPIAATTTITVEGDSTTETPVDEEAGQVIEITVSGGEVTGGGRHEVALGERVTLRVTSDIDDHVHLHGYDVFQDVAAGEAAELTFEADIPGVFEVELEDSVIQLVELEVS